MGGGQDRVQHAAAADLARLRPWLAAVIDDGGVVFAVCAGLQLLGRRYVAADGSELAGLGLLDLETLAAKRGEWRLIGNVVAEVRDLGGQPGQAAAANAAAGDGAATAAEGSDAAAAQPRLLVGFENHGGRTFLGAARPLGRVLLGFGNNGQDGGEGVQAGRVIATYLHGPGAAQERLAHRPPSGAGPRARPRRPAGAARPPARRRGPGRSRAGRRARRAPPRAPRARGPPAATGGGPMTPSHDAPSGTGHDAGVQRLLADFRRLLGPGERPAIAGLEIGCLYRTRGDDDRSELREIDGFGGDFVDFFSPGRLSQLVVTLGDVRGKGVGAAARAIVAKYVTRAMVTAQRWPLLPGEALRDVNNALLAVPHEPHDSSPSASPRSTLATARWGSPRRGTRAPSCCVAPASSDHCCSAIRHSA